MITNAAYNNPNVKGLVYLAAFAPNEGQSLSNFVDTAKFPKGFLVVDSGGFVYINPAMFPQAFAQDIDPAQAKVMAATQKPFSQSILAEKSGPAAWKQLPAWYQISENCFLEKYRTINIVPIIPSGAPKPIISTISISTIIWKLQLLLIKFKF